jgi:retinol dehydrogenase-12
MGHFLLTQLLLERIKESAPARIVTVSSRAHNKTDGIDWNKVRQPTSTLLGIREYAVSKLANVLFSAELGRRLIGRGVTTYSLHPGVIDSDIWRTLPGPLRVINRLRLKSPVVGAATLLHCALSDAVSSETGLYYSDCEKKLPSRAAQDGELAYALWHRSNEWVHDWLSQ